MTRRVRFHRWTGDELDRGTHEGTTVREGVLTIAGAIGTRKYDDPHRPGAAEEWDHACWTSPETSPGFGFTELVGSWNVRTPAGTWVEIAFQVDGPRGRSGWQVMGRWAETDLDISPTSVPGQAEGPFQVDVDRLLVSSDAPGATYRLRVTLLRRPGSAATPTVALLGAVASDQPESGPPTDADAGPGADAAGPRGRVLEVPGYSQRLHLWAYPQWADGGSSWCSPTATSMVLDYWGLGPSPADYAWVDTSLPDRFVPYAARHTLDHAYRAAGNWSFNAAYAARFGAEAFVTRLRSLDEAELFVAAGIPLVVGVAFTRDQLDGAGYDTHGHLAVLAGFDDAGRVVCNDPASHGIPSNQQVRTTFDRAQFEAAWMRAAGGVTYVIRPPAVPLPTPPAEANW